MEPSPDELAGVVDLFGALTRDELATACVELAHKAGDNNEAVAFGSVIDDALAEYRLVAVENDGEAVLVVGPTAFPELPAGGRDLPHILAVDERTVPPGARAEAAERRFRREAAGVVERGDEAAIERLLDVSYELEVWGPVNLGETRQRLDSALEGE